MAWQKATRGEHSKIVASKHSCWNVVDRVSLSSSCVARCLGPR